MPIYKCPNGKYRIGGGPCIYDTLEVAKRAYAAYLAKTHDKQLGKRNGRSDMGKGHA